MKDLEPNAALDVMAAYFRVLRTCLNDALNSVQAGGRLSAFPVRAWTMVSRDDNNAVVDGIDRSLPYVSVDVASDDDPRPLKLVMGARFRSAGTIALLWRAMAEVRFVCP